MSPHDYVNIWHDVQQCCIKQIHSQNMEWVSSLFQACASAASAASRRVPRDGQPQAQSHQAVHDLLRTFCQHQNALPADNAGKQAAGTGTEQTELEPALEPEQTGAMLRLTSEERASICKVQQWIDAGGGKAPALCTVQQLGEVPSKATQTRRARTARERAATPTVFEQSAEQEKKRKRDNNADEEIALYQTRHETAP